MIKCEICNQGIKEGKTIFRIKEKDKIGWRCKECMTTELTKTIDSEIRKLVKIIEASDS